MERGLYHDVKELQGLRVHFTGKGATTFFKQGFKCVSNLNATASKEMLRVWMGLSQSTCASVFVGPANLGLGVQEVQSRWRQADFVPANFSTTLYEELIHKPLCDLFLPSTAPGFVGHCQVPEDDMSRSCPGHVSLCHGPVPSYPLSSQKILPSVRARVLSGMNLRSNC